MSGNDLTRWNRSGLSRLQYVNGNAATYLDKIRTALNEKFPDVWRDKPEPSDNGADLEENEEWIQHAKNKHLIKQYLAERSDIGWEIVRAFVRSCHVLTSHMDAHANETFLRTATQWNYIRKMVAMLDYHPPGATSAKTLLAIKVRKKRKGIIEKGLQVRHRPLSGGKPIVFETLEDLDANWKFNEFRVDGHDQSQKKLSKAEEEAGNAEGIFDIKKSPWTANPKAPVAIKDSAIIIKDAEESAAEAAWVLDKKGSRIKLGHEGDNWKNWSVGEVRLKSSPRFKHKPWINGKLVRRATVPHGISEGSVIAWRSNVGETDKYAWRFAEIERADSMGLELVIDEKFKKFLDENGNPAYNSKGYSADDIWPDWSIDDIEVRRATKLTNSFAVPAGSEAEKRIGDLANFTSANMVSSGGNINDDDKVFTLFKFENGKIDKHKLDTNVDQDQDFMNFIRWLFKASGFIASFPPSPDILVKIGALLMLKDARIPSTGQLVFEAFLDIFGGNGDQKDYTKDQQGTIPALFRFWIEKEEEEEETEWNEARPSGRPPLGIKGELWYLQEKKEGGGHVEGDLETFSLKNQHDKCWFFFNGKPTGINVDDWAAAKFKLSTIEERWYAVRIEEIKKIKAPKAPPEEGVTTASDPIDPPDRYVHPAAFALLLKLPDWEGNPFNDLNEIPEMVEFQADFRHEGELVGADINEADLGDSIKLTRCPKNLSVGRTMLAVNEDKGIEVRVKSVNPDNCSVELDPPLGKSFNQGNLMLFGNIVQAGHGERQPAALLGAGTGAQRLNHLMLESKEVSTVPDKRQAGGAREDLTVRIGDEQWHQVIHLDQSEPTDRHFMVSTTEEGYLKLQFGDDRRGRSLPPGTNNVRVDYRIGAGSRGSVPPGSLEQLVQPHPLVESVQQPFEAIGGADMESPEHMRERAPASLLALERAVSITDFEQLAMQHRSVRQARAFYYIGSAGQRDKVEVVIALADGKKPDGNMKKEIADYLQQRAVPTVRVDVIPYISLEVKIRIDIRVNYATYEADKVVIKVKEAIAETFSAARRGINQALHLSEVYAEVEKVPGVEDSICTFELNSVSTKQQTVEAETKEEIVFIPGKDAVICDYWEYKP
ncbi:MAG: baseplate J/gp47 family protein [Deltaproteobacteria bacterium]|jgi:hypothetical protein|nr:baseplate J/gp47 family protein [Deltaproteobacteria bacterium]